MTLTNSMLINEEPIVFEGERLNFYFSQYVNNHLPAIVCDSLDSGPYATITVNLDLLERIENKMYDSIDIAFNHDIVSNNTAFTKLCEEILVEGPTWPIKYGFASSIAGKLKSSIIMKFFDMHKVS